jgi:hypothetical protein
MAPLVIVGRGRRDRRWVRLIHRLVAFPTLAAITLLAGSCTSGPSGEATASGRATPATSPFAGH